MSSYEIPCDHYRDKLWRSRCRRNETEAQEKARQEYYNGNVFWKDSEISDLNAEAAHRQQKDRGEAR